MGQATVSASSVNVRSGPSTSKKWLGRLNKGETFSYTNDQNGWLQTEYKNQTAYVCKKYTTTSASTTEAPTTATPAPTATAAPTSTESSSVSINVQSAISYNKKRGYSAAKWKKIQAQIGATQTGKSDQETAIAVAEWQQGHGLKVDGKCGPATLATMNLDSSTPTTTTTPTPTTTTEAPAPTTTETPTTTTETPTTTTEAPAPATENLLSAKQVEAAISYSVKNNLASIWKDIQSVVGTAQTNQIDEVSVQAIASWQKSNGLEADGKFGKKSLEKAGLSPGLGTKPTL